MAHEKVPNYGTQAFGVRRDARIVNDGNQDARRRALLREPAVLADDAEDRRLAFSCQLESTNEIDAHVLLTVPTTHGEYQQCVARIETRGLQPLDERRVPTF